MPSCELCGTEAELTKMKLCYLGNVNERGKLGIVRHEELAACEECRAELRRGRRPEAGKRTQKEAA